VGPAHPIDNARARADGRARHFVDVWTTGRGPNAFWAVFDGSTSVWPERDQPACHWPLSDITCAKGTVLACRNAGGAVGIGAIRNRTQRGKSGRNGACGHGCVRCRRRANIGPGRRDTALAWGGPAAIPVQRRAYGRGSARAGDDRCVAGHADAAAIDVDSAAAGPASRGRPVIGPAGIVRCGNVWRVCKILCPGWDAGPHWSCGIRIGSIRISYGRASRCIWRGGIRPQGRPRVQFCAHGGRIDGGPYGRAGFDGILSNARHGGGSIPDVGPSHRRGSHPRTNSRVYVFGDACGCSGGKTARNRSANIGGRGIGDSRHAGGTNLRSVRRCNAICDRAARHPARRSAGGNGCNGCCCAWRVRRRCPAWRHGGHGAG
jgi:hypothetical protein